MGPFGSFLASRARPGGPGRRGPGRDPPKPGRVTYKRPPDDIVFAVLGPFGLPGGSRVGPGRAPFGPPFRVRFLDRFGVRLGRPPGPTRGPSGRRIWSKMVPKPTPRPSPKPTASGTPSGTRFWSKTGARPDRKPSKSVGFLYDFHEIATSGRKPATRAKKDQKGDPKGAQKGAQIDPLVFQAASGKETRTGTDFRMILDRVGVVLGAGLGSGSGPERGPKQPKKRSELGSRQKS